MKESVLSFFRQSEIFQDIKCIDNFNADHFFNFNIYCKCSLGVSVHRCIDAVVNVSLVVPGTIPLLLLRFGNMTESTWSMVLGLITTTMHTDPVTACYFPYELDMNTIQLVLLEHMHPVFNKSAYITT
jgi:hypothetical protein